MKPIEQIEQEAIADLLGDQLAPARGCMNGVLMGLAFWIALALFAFVAFALPSHASGFRVPEFYQSCKPVAGTRIIHVSAKQADATCRALGVTAPYVMAGCNNPAKHIIVLPRKQDVGAAWYAEFYNHEAAHSWGWPATHPYFKSKLRLCK